MANPGPTASPQRTAVLEGDLNRSTQHFTFEREVECDAITTEATFLYGSGEC
jgi:hypothetical protein